MTMHEPEHEEGEGEGGEDGAMVEYSPPAIVDLAPTRIARALLARVLENASANLYEAAFRDVAYALAAFASADVRAGREFLRCAVEALAERCATNDLRRRLAEWRREHGEMFAEPVIRWTSRETGEPLSVRVTLTLDAVDPVRAWPVSKGGA